jgi:phage baseplate assembly protein W
MASENEDINTSYLGTGWSFPPAFSRGTQTVIMVSDEEDIQHSIATLLSTTVGERIMQHEYGCNLFRLLFEPMNTSTQTLIKNMIQRAFLYFESRVVLEDVAFEVFQTEGLIRVNLRYTIIATNNRYNYVYPFYLNEASNIAT